MAKRRKRTNSKVPAVFCKRPDRDVPGIQCGHPLPCPYHTVVIDTTTEPPQLHIPITSEPARNEQLQAMLKEIGLAIIDDMEHNSG